jgi:flagellin
VLTTATQSLTNTSNYNATGAFAAFGVAGGTADTAQTEVVRFTTGGKDYDVTLSSDVTDVAHYADTLPHALTMINKQLAGSGIKAVLDAGGSNISFQSASSFNIAETFTAGTTSDGATFTGSLFAASSGKQDVTAADASTSATGSALSAVDAITDAIGSLGLVQGRVGAGQNQLSYAISLAQSQITNFQSAESQIRDTDVAAEAANLSKAQVLQQAAIAAMAQANSAPQQVLSLLRG